MVVVAAVIAAAVAFSHNGASRSSRVAAPEPNSTAPADPNATTTAVRKGTGPPSGKAPGSVTGPTALAGHPFKPALRGLLDRNGIPPAGYRDDMAGGVIRVRWADLQAAPGGDLAADNDIDHTIAEVRALNATRPSNPLGLKLRVTAGIDSPDWAKQLGGSPVAVHDPFSGASGTAPRFWTDEFGAAYRDLQARLAARYDGVAELREVAITRCTTVFAEPFLRQASDPATAGALVAAGLTEALDERCLGQQLQDHLAWTTTRSDLALNPYQRVARPGSGSKGGSPVDLALTLRVMDLCRETLGTRCGLENNSLRTPVQAGNAPIYDRMRVLGGPISFQTASAERAGDLQATIQSAIGYGASSVELPESYTRTISNADFHGTFAPQSTGLGAQPSAAG